MGKHGNPYSTHISEKSNNFFLKKIKKLESVGEIWKPQVGGGGFARGKGNFFSFFFFKKMKFFNFWKTKIWFFFGGGEAIKKIIIEKQNILGISWWRGCRGCSKSGEMFFFSFQKTDFSFILSKVFLGWGWWKIGGGWPGRGDNFLFQ